MEFGLLGYFAYLVFVAKCSNGTDTVLVRHANPSAVDHSDFLYVTQLVSLFIVKNIETPGNSSMQFDQSYIKYLVLAKPSCNTYKRD